MEGITRAGLIAGILALICTAPALADLPSAEQIVDASQLISGLGAEGQIGDFLMWNGVLAVVIEDAGNAHGDGMSGGNIVDAAVLPHWEDLFGTHFTFVGGPSVQAVYDTVYIESDGSGGEAVVVAEGIASGDPSLAVRTFYSLEADVPYLTIETSITNNGTTSTEYSGGDALNWDYGDHFVPGYGFDVTGVTTFSTWLAGGAGGIAYGYLVPTGTVKSTHGTLWSDPVISSGSLSPEESAWMSRVFVVGGMGIGSVSDVAHELRGEQVGTVAGTVRDASTGDPIEGATIDCEVGGSSPYTQARSDSLGSFSATLLPGNYTLGAAAVAYLRSEQPASILVGQETEVHFELLAGNWNPDIGDTLTYVMRPILSVPAILVPGDDLTIEAAAPQSTTGWTATLRLGTRETLLTVSGATFDVSLERWFISAELPDELPADVYDLVVTASGGIHDEVAHCVAVEDEMDGDFYFVHITDSTEMDDMRAVIEDINLINPAFVLLTGDVVNEGELEDYLEWRSFTKAKRIMRELDVPVYMTAGNHDVGGWDSTPPPAGTSRRNWWKFFGWRHLYDPPPGDQIYTQNYSFDYGGVHFMGVEAYDNYDGWRSIIYGRESVTLRQLSWLIGELGVLDPAVPTVAFYHYDFNRAIRNAALGVDCSLWGHIHRTTGQIDSPPFSLSTDSVCDGERAMRLVRVSGGNIQPTEAFSAGPDGDNLRAVFDGPNDGTATSLSVQIVNTHPQTFEDGLVRFCVAADSIPYAATGGRLLQTVVEGTAATCYVSVEMAPGVTEVSIAPTDPPPETAVAAILRQSRPNPAAAGTEIGFVLPYAAEVKLEVFDSAGRKVVTLEDGPLGPGPHAAPWDLRDADGNAVATGVYFYRLEAGDAILTKKLVVVR
jgi:hypothetical protein